MRAVGEEGGDLDDVGQSMTICPPSFRAARMIWQVISSRWAIGREWIIPLT